MYALDELQERIEEFLRSFRDEEGNLVYLPRIQTMSLDRLTSLSVDFQDLVSFDNVFVEVASKDPDTFLRAANNALVSILELEDPDYVDDMERRAFKFRIVNYTDHIPLRAIRSKHIGRLIHISGIMMRASEVKPLLVEAVFMCRVCGSEIVQPQEDGRYTEPLQCDICQKKTPLKLLPEKSRFVDWQKVRIQESPEELPPGQMPRSVDVILEGDIVDLSRPGDLVRITGILRTLPDFSRRGGRLATFNVYVEANGIEIAEKEYEEMSISEEDERQIRELADDPYVHERIYASIAPSIHGHELIKESIALLLFGGVGKTLPDGTRLRGRSNILIIGDPGTGKSQMLKFVAGLAQRGLYTSGKGTTAAGLTAAVVRDADTGAMTLEAGALVLADQGIACIDEFDKMDPNDRTAIHEAMEQHTVSIAKAGIVATLNARTSILAAANPALGRYEPSLSVQDNIKLPFTILSRFDLIWILVDTVEAEKDRELARFILGMHQRQRTPIQEKIRTLHPDFLRKYIAYASRENPVLTPEAAEVIENFYVDLRKTAEGGAAPVPITARQLESLVRLAEARARMALRPKVTKEDAEAAVHLMEQSLRMVAFDRVTGKIDIDRLVSKMSASQRSLSDTIIKTMRDFETEGLSVVDEETLIERVVAVGHPRDRVEDTIRKLVTEGILFNPRAGKIKRAQG
ncbi:MAG: minichromosome maintenance protein MCM [Candidatus Thorarchaeota archaeon]|nr:MAG: Minichromosome maintenance protein MCM [Candidatus Thorarchaeota archaeon]